MTHDEIQTELSAYALGALDPDERVAVEQHLGAGCVECERELAAWREVVASVAVAAPPAEAEQDAPALTAALRERLKPIRSAKVIALPRWSLIPLAAAAAAVLAFGLTRETGLRSDIDAQRGEMAALHAQLGDAQGQQRKLMEQLAAKETDLGSLRVALAAAHEQLAIVQSPGLQMVRLLQTPDAKPAEAHVLIAKDKAVFYAFDLPMVSPDRAYELWWITEKQGPVKAGLFVPDERGLGRIELDVPADLGVLQAAAVTVEPKDGVEKPTGPMVLIGKLPVEERG
jgi:anti-sigma-K factor RskA